MSKSLRMLLLSMLVVAVAAMPAMAANNSPTFYWTGAAGNSWTAAGNWVASPDYAAYNKTVDSVDSTVYYPGSNKISSDFVVISRDASISLGSELAKTVSCVMLGNGANVTIDLGGYGQFATIPSIDVTSGSLTLKGTTARPLNRAATLAVRNKSSLTLDMPVSALTSRDELTLSVDAGGTLTVNNATVLGYTTINTAGKLVLNAAPEKAAAAGKKLNINLLGSKAELNTPSDVTLHANYGTSASQDYVISGDFFKKTGAGTLTLSRDAPAKYATPVGSRITSVDVEAGTLVFGRPRIAEHSFDIIVSKDAKLNVSATNAICTSGEVELRVNGTVEIAKAGIGAIKDVYASTGLLALNQFNISADVSSTGTLTFKGTQPVKHLSGAGAVTVDGSDAVLIVSGDANAIKGFTGTLDASNVGLAEEFGDMPFANASTSDIETVYVYGSATLTLDAVKLASSSGLDELTVYLRSNYGSPDVLANSMVGAVKVSGDVAIGTLKVDGTKNADGIAEVLFTSSKDILTVDSLVLHANGVNDPTMSYAAVHALVVSSDKVGKDGGTFVPKAISNAEGATGTNLGSDTSITVQGATLKLDVDIPASNSLVLDNATLEAANGVKIPGDLILRNNNTFKLTVTGSNMKLYTGGDNALNVDDDFVLAGNVSFDLSLNDDKQAIANKYRLIGSTTGANNKLTSTGLGAMEVIGTLKGAVSLSADVYGVYGILEELALQPRVLVNGAEAEDGGSWSVSKLGDNDFKAKISYDIPANVEPASLIKLVSVDVEISGKHFNAANTARENISNVVHVKTFKISSSDREIEITGMLYAEKVETKVTLGWSTVSRDWRPYAAAGMYFNGQALESRDFKPADTITLVITNPVNESPDVPGEGELSEDVVADPEEVSIDIEAETVTAGSQDVVLTIKGIRKKPAESSGYAPVLLNGTYVWMNGYDPATEKYQMKFSEEWYDVSLDIKINGVSVNMASVDIEGSDPVTITIPGEFFTTDLAYTAPQEVSIVGVTENGKTITATTSVWVRPASYEAGEIDADYVSSGPSDVTRTVVQSIPLEGTISYDILEGTMPVEWLDLEGIAAGVISFTVPAGTAAGVYTMNLDVFTTEGGYNYTFTYEVIAGFEINDPDEPYGTIGGLSYQAEFTTNAPEGTAIEWALSTDLTWLKGAPSTDKFVVYGSLPEWIDTSDMEEEPEVDPNEYTYTVTAKPASGDAKVKVWTITVEEDTDAADTVDYTEFEAGSIIPSGDIASADSNYNVEIAFTEDYYDTEIEFLSLPYWLEATPVMDEEGVITGYTLTYKNGAAVTAGDTGVVRFEDPASGNIISWNVTFGETIMPTPPAPEAGFTLSADAAVTLSVDSTATMTLTPANELGAVTYEYTVTPTTGLSVDITGNQVTFTGTAAGTYTVVFTATDAGRETDNTATATTTVTVSGETPGPGPQPGAFEITATPSSLTFTVGENLAQTVTMRATAGGTAVEDVTYESDQDWAVVDGSTVMVTAPETAGTYTITITGTAPDGRTDTATVSVTVTGGSSGGDFAISTNSSVALDLATADGYTAELTLTAANAVGTVNYSYAVTPDDGGVEVEIADNKATITGVEVGEYSVVFTGTDSAGNTATFTTKVVVTSSGSVGSSGGGCDAGFGALALALAAPLFLRRRRS